MTNNNKAYNKYIDTNLANLLFSQYEDMAIQMIKWDGLDDSIPRYVPERYLFSQGQCCCLKLPGTDDIAFLPVAYGSVRMDIYGNPTEWRAFATGNSPLAQIINNTQLNEDNSVVIFNNQKRAGDAPFIRSIVNKMSMIDKTLDINCILQRTPFVAKGNEKNLLTITNVFKEIYGGKGFIIDTGANVLDNVDVLNLNIPFIGAELSDQYETYHNRILRYLGINHLPVEKQERMLTGEVNSNDEEITIRRATKLSYRENAVDKINDLFGLEIEVYYDEPEQPRQQPISYPQEPLSGPSDGTQQTTDA